MGIPTGLDYSAVEAYCRLCDIAVTPDTFAGLQVCERAALKAMSERQATEKRNHG